MHHLAVKRVLPDKTCEICAFCHDSLAAQKWAEERQYTVRLIDCDSCKLIESEVAKLEQKSPAPDEGEADKRRADLDRAIIDWIERNKNPK